jgi:hypothetical protein
MEAKEESMSEDRWMDLSITQGTAEHMTTDEFHQQLNRLYSFHGRRNRRPRCQLPMQELIQEALNEEPEADEHYDWIFHSTRVGEPIGRFCFPCCKSVRKRCYNYVIIANSIRQFSIKS